MALNKRIMAIVEQAKIKGDELNELLASRRDRRNNAIRNYVSDELDDIETGDVARDEIDFIQRIEASTSEDVSRFAETADNYLAGAPAGDRKRLADNLLRYHEAIVGTDAA